MTWSIPAGEELAAGECMALTVTVDVDQSVVTSEACINTAEISADSGDDIDSTPDAVLTGTGADGLVDITDATGLAAAPAVAGDEDDHDIAVCTAAALAPTTTTTPAAPAAAPILPVAGTDTGGVAGLALVILTLGASLLFVGERARYTAIMND